MGRVILAGDGVACEEAQLGTGGDGGGHLSLTITEPSESRSHVQGRQILLAMYRSTCSLSVPLGMVQLRGGADRLRLRLSLRNAAWAAVSFIFIFISIV